MLIKILLILAILAVMVTFLRNRNAMRFQAGKKVLFALFLIACAVAVVLPDLLTDVANLVGVGRGTDLLLYALVVAFFYVALNTYLKFKDYDARLTKLARRVAIDQALDEQRQPGRPQSD